MTFGFRYAGLQCDVLCFHCLPVLQYAEVLPVKNGQAHPLEDEVCGALPSWTSHVGLIPAEHKQERDEEQFTWVECVFRKTRKMLGKNTHPVATLE